MEDVHQEMAGENNAIDELPIASQKF